MNPKMFFQFSGEGKYKLSQPIEVQLQNINKGDSVMFDGDLYSCTGKSFHYPGKNCEAIYIYLDSGKRKFSI